MAFVPPPSLADAVAQKHPIRFVIELSCTIDADRARVSSHGRSAGVWRDAAGLHPTDILIVAVEYSKGYDLPGVEDRYCRPYLGGADGPLRI
jgi:hypothetical protein